VSAGTWAVGAVTSLALAGAFAAQMARWLRVLQREHYEPGAMRRFLGRWTTPPVASAKSPERLRSTRPFTLSHLLFLVFAVSLVLGATTLAVLASVGYGLFCPWGLSIRGRTGPLRWTRRLGAIAAVAGVVAGAVTALGTFTPMPWLGALAAVWAVPALLDVTARLLAPYERRRARDFVAQAAERLSRVAPRVVAITGSYGKTSTKHHLVELLGADGVVASPKSYNNRAGLSRAVNENLSDGTRVFVAEMGTYGPGEIRELCSWCPPEIAVVTAIGPVHLERMKSLDVIEQAKHEVTENAATVVLNVDDPRLARWPEPLRRAGKRVVMAGSRNEAATVRVAVSGDGWSLVVDGEVVVALEPLAGVQPTNVALAAATALELGTGPQDLAQRVGYLSAVDHRAQLAVAPSGVTVIDDTFNANPASAEAALALLASLPAGGRRVVVTPGLVELGREQYAANLLLAQKVRARGAELAIVGRTNAVPMAIGAEGRLHRFDTREDAVAWVRGELGAGDAVLYLNDLPDHYP
jgi:UDP-N-acetylmuramoyl-tripeptide--D-alanyl-D-alanine ligase